MTAATTIEPTIIIDSREQCPWQFSMPTETGSLYVGDYSIRGLERLVSIERKSLPDLLSCVGQDRERFEHCLDRIQARRFKLLVIEASAEDLERGEWRSRVHPNAVLGSLASWTGRFGIPVWLGGSREPSARFAERWLRLAAETVAAENRALGVNESSEVPA